MKAFKSVISVFLLLLVLILGNTMLLPVSAGTEENTKSTGLATLTTKNTYSNPAVTNGELTYYMYVPTDYDAAKSYSLLVYFHGENGFDFEGEEALLLRDVVYSSAYSSNTIVMVPVCYANSWVNTQEPSSASYSFADTPQSEIEKLVIDCINGQIKKEYQIRGNGVLLAGYSMGATMVWDMLYRAPGDYAAGMVVAGGMDPTAAQTVKSVPLWIFHASDDDVMKIETFRNMYQALSNAKAENVHLKEYEKGGHKIAGTAFADTEAVKWLLNIGRENEITDAALLDIVPDGEKVSAEAAADFEDTDKATDETTTEGSTRTIRFTEKTIASAILIVAGLISILLLFMGYTSTKNKA